MFGAEPKSLAAVSSLFCRVVPAWQVFLVTLLSQVRSSPVLTNKPLRRTCLTSECKKLPAMRLLLAASTGDDCVALVPGSKAKRHGPVAL